MLRPILRALGAGGDARWRSVLLAVFWPGLESIFWQKRRFDPDPERRWQNVTWAFLQTVCALDVERRPARLAAKVINDTVNRLYRDYRSEWDRAEAERATEQGELLALGGEAEDMGIAAVDLFDALRGRLARLREHVEGGRISETDYLMLVATRIYGEPLAEWSRDHDVDYEAHRGTLEALSKMVRPGGLVLAGEPFWKTPPEPEYLKLTELEAESFGSHSNNVQAGVDLGLTFLYSIVSSEDDWDRYEGLQWQAAERHVTAHPDDPDAEALLDTMRRDRDGYLRWGRDCLGWAMYLFSTP